MYPDKQTISEYFCYENGSLLNRKTMQRKRSKSGCIAGSKTEVGYMRVKFLDKNYYVHRLIWILFYGAIDEADQVDHINGVKSDNRIENLRKVSRAENNQNLRAAKKNNTTGFLGVSFRKTTKKFEAQIKTNGITTALGRFATAELAGKAYLDAKRTLHVTCSI